MNAGLLFCQRSVINYEKLNFKEILADGLLAVEDSHKPSATVT